MSATTARALLRPSRLALRSAPARSASSTSEAASNAAAKSKETASKVTSKASEGLSRVQSSANSVISKAGPAISQTLGKVGGRTGRLISAVQSMIPPTVYYAKVGAELSRIVFHGQKMQPPSTAQFQHYLQPIINALRNPQSLFSSNPALLNPQQYLNRARGLSTQQLAAIGIVGAEVLGFFTVGEMLGKLKVVGYRNKGPAAEEHH